MKSEHQPAVHVPNDARVAIVWSTYDPEITGSLRDAAVETWLEAGGTRENLVEHTAAGSFELPLIAAALAQSGAFDAIVTLGCIIRGETSHDVHIAAAVAQGIMQSSLETGIPIAFGVLTVNTRGQALDRAGGSRGNKGVEAMTAVLSSLSTLEQIAGAELSSGEAG